MEDRPTLSTGSPARPGPAKALFVRAARLLLMQEDVLLGGQAVLEGVMMRSPHAMAVAVRRPDGDIVVFRQKILSLADMHPVLRWPVVRGAVVMIQSLVLGFRSLNFSAEAAFETVVDAPGAADETKAGGAAAKGGSWAIAGSLVVALALGFGLFFLLPLALTQAARLWIPALSNGLAFNLVDGVFRISIFLGYILGISMLRDIRRVFEYHGAEHKTVHAHEAGVPLTVDNVRVRSRLHPRCGTSFLLVVMVVSILAFSFLPADKPFYVMIFPRLAMIPIIAGLSYEAIRFSARHARNVLCRALIQPGLWLQKLTTQEPSDDQIAIGIRALEEALVLEGRGGAEVVPA